MQSSRQRELLNEVLLVARDISFRSGAIFQCPKGTTQISHGTRTKCRKTRAMQGDFTILNSLALRQCDTSMIPDTHSLKLLFPTRYISRSINLCSKNDFCKTTGSSKATLYVKLAPHCHLFYNISILFLGAYA